MTDADSEKDMLFVLLAICEGIPLEVFKKQWFETSWCSLMRHCNVDEVSESFSTILWELFIMLTLLTKPLPELMWICHQWITATFARELCGTCSTSSATREPFRLTLNVTPERAFSQWLSENVISNRTSMAEWLGHWLQWWAGGVSLRFWGPRFTTGIRHLKQLIHFSYLLCCQCTEAWASYQIRKIVGCACAGNAGNVFPRRL